MTADNYINVWAGAGGVKIICRKANSLLPKEVIVEIDNWGISFIRPSISYNGKLHTFSTTTDKDWMYMRIICTDLPCGKFYFEEEECNEDCLVAYFETN